MSVDLLVTSHELAERARVTKRTVCCDVRRGLLPYKELGRQTQRRGPRGYLFTEQQALDYVAYRATLDGKESRSAGWKRRRDKIISAITCFGIDATAATLGKTPDQVKRMSDRWKRKGLWTPTPAEKQSPQPSEPAPQTTE